MPNCFPKRSYDPKRNSLAHHRNRHVCSRTAAQKRNLVAKLTAAAVSALEVTPNLVRVRINEVLPQHSAVGGVLLADPTAGPEDNETAE